MNPADGAAMEEGEQRVSLAFIGLMALMSSVIAFSTDAMLPVMGEMSAALGQNSGNARQDIVTYLFAGLALSQLFFGPLSDSFGRKVAAQAGFLIFVIGSAICIMATSFEAMQLGRVLQGFGAGGPRIVSIAIIRDLYAGRAMARVVSLMSSIFILAPMLAPAIGQGVAALAGWRAIFVTMFAMGLIGTVWLWLGLAETLTADKRATFSLRRIAGAFRETLTHPVSLGYSILTGLTFSAFVAYLATAEQVYRDVYKLGGLFPLAFASMAACFGAATLVNARLVGRYGMRPLTLTAIVAMTVCASVGFAVSAFVFGGNPPLWLFLALIGPIFFCVGVTFGNFNALALEPMGHIAGVASSVVASLSTLIAMLLGGWIAARFEGTVDPLLSGFALSGVAGLVVIRLTERARARWEAV